MSNFQQQQMGVGQMMPQMGQQQQRQPQNTNASAQIQQMIYATLTQQPGPLSGWQAQVLPNERMGLIFNIIGNLRLASQHQPNPPTLQRMIEIGIRFEKDIFEKSPNKDQYKHQVQLKLEQLLERRNQNQANMQQQIQQQAQQQAQQMMMNQNPMQGQGPRPMPQQAAQQGFSHLQHQMQASPIPGQQPPQAPMGIPNQGSQNMAQNQQQQFANAMQQGQPQQNHQGRVPNGGQPQLSQQDNALVMDLTNRLAAQASEEEKANLRVSLQQRMEPQQFARYQSQGIDPVLLYFRNQAVNRLRQEKQVRLAQAQQQLALGQQSQNVPASAPPMQQQRSMNPSPMNGQTQPPTTSGANPDFTSFMGNMGDLAAQQQQQGVMAQAEGQMVVPVSGAPRNATPQPGVMPGQNMAMNEQRGPPNPNPGAQQRQHMINQQMQQQRMNQTQQQQQQQSQNQARLQAHVKAQQMALQGQPGGMGPGPVPPQPSPAMPTLNAPIRTPSQQPMNQPETPQVNVSAQFGQPLDPRFMQGNQRQPGFGNGLNSAALAQAMFASMPPETQKNLSQLPQEKLNEVVGKWHAQRQQEIQANGRQQMNMQGGQVRPGQQMGPGGPFNPQNPGAQFMGGPGQRPQPGMGANMSAQQQMILQQQMAALRPTPLQQQQQQQQQQQRNMQQNLNIEQRMALQMDGVDVPQVYQSHPTMPQGFPPELKKWGQLKQWAASNPNLGPAGLESIKTLQKHHYSNIVRSRSQQNGQPGMMQPGLQGPQGMPGAAPGMAAPVAPMGQNPVQMNNPMSIGTGAPIRQPTQQEIQAIRNHPSGKMATASDDQIRTIFLRNHQQQQQQQGQMTPQQLQQQRQVMAAQMTRMQAQQGGGQQPHQPGLTNGPAAVPQQKPNQTPQQKPQPAPEPTSTPNNANPARAARQQPGDHNAAQNSSPAQPAKNLKRASSGDDVVEVPNPNTQRPQTAAQNTQEANQPNQHGPPKLTPQQIEKLNPEQRKAYQLFLQKQQASQTNSRMQVNPVDLEKLKAIEKEEQERASAPLPDLPLDEEYKTKIRSQVRSIISSMQNVNKAMPRWYQITHNEERARQFFRARFRLAKQFHDGETMQQLKDNFSISPQEVEHIKLLLNAIIQDLSTKFPNMKTKPQGASTTQAGTQPQPQAAQAPTPLNAANLQQQQQQLKMHQRSNSRSSHTPAAPTSEQPPNLFGGARSPHGAPSYLNNNTLTQEKMHIPARKKQKQNSTPVPGQGTPGSTASPQVPKAVSPELKRQQAEAKSQTKMFTCTDSECDGRNITFDNQEALDAHRSEEHVIADPLKFVQDTLASGTGLDAQGQPKKASGQEASYAPTTAPTSVKMMKAGSKQAHTPTVKGENTSAATTPMNRQVSMHRQGSAAGGKPNVQSNTTSAKDASSKSHPVSKEQPKTEPQPSAPVDPWANATIDPTELYQTFQPYETGAGGAISDMNVYRSITPNDTPESSKDGVSEPNSDISEGVGLDINLDLDLFDPKWVPFGPNDADTLFDMDSYNFNGGMDDLVMFDDDQKAGNFGLWDEVDPSALDKPFSFDPSFHSMNTE
ncbi:uncharacterized protein LY89DRAFT_418839 [Mollisia scopiformis]|uniref:Mediator complex subunit 15 KIX domain-containing protein n=1 Tax=Mollisia scopiformis TaxID=149040 RepID=A0A194XKZ9_MOLSC|nr:uncharacterized protein LY89DRAFT_418839 [Mollisia scopiformis]KUJ20910.1 hypothetical protein LY89DRAFT_418839 [Mollisia scopiformis]